MPSLALVQRSLPIPCTATASLLDQWMTNELSGITWLGCRTVTGLVDQRGLQSTTRLDILERILGSGVMRPTISRTAVRNLRLIG